MIPDPTDEIRAIRQALAAKFDNDLHRIAEDIRRQQRESGRTYITLPRRAPQRDSTTTQEIHANISPSVLENGETSPVAG